TLFPYTTLFRSAKGTTRASARSCGAVRFGRPPTSQAVAAVHPSRSSASTSNSSRRHTDRPKDAYGVPAILPRPEGRGLPRTGSTANIGTNTSQGNDRLLFGIIMGVIAFWLFAQTTLNIAPDMSRDLGMTANTMNIAVAITALFSGIFIVVMGGLADRMGHMKIVRWGFYLNIVGSLLVGLTPAGDLGVPVLLTGRALQGLSAACIMPASLAVVKAYWDGAGRQRAISMWSIGSWGGSGLCSLFGGLMS